MKPVTEIAFRKNIPHRVSFLLNMYNTRQGHFAAFLYFLLFASFFEGRTQCAFRTGNAISQRQDQIIVNRFSSNNSSNTFICRISSISHVIIILLKHHKPTRLFIVLFPICFAFVSHLFHICFRGMLSKVSLESRRVGRSRADSNVVGVLKS